MITFSILLPYRGELAADLTKCMTLFLFPGKFCWESFVCQVLEFTVGLYSPPREKCNSFSLLHRSCKDCRCTEALPQV